MSAVGAGAAPTFTVTESLAVPPGPVQFKVYVVLAVKLPVDWLPETPVQPGALTVHEVVLVDVQLIVAAVL
jgi:hypothetical protein